MSKLGLWAAACLALVAAPALSAPLELYGRLPTIEEVKISPDGARLAVIATDGENRKIIIQDLATQKIIRQGDGGTTKLNSLTWAGSDHLIVTKSTTTGVVNLEGPRREWWQAADYDIPANRLRPLLNDAEDALTTIFDYPVVRTVKGKPVVFLQALWFPLGKGRLSVYRIDLGNGASWRFTEGSEVTNDWLIGADGETLAQTTYVSKSGRWTLKMKPERSWVESRSIVAPIERPGLVGLGRAEKSVLVRDWNEDGEVIMREVAADGTWGDPLPFNSPDSPVFDPRSHQLIGYSKWVGDTLTYSFFDARDQAVIRGVQKAYPGQIVKLVSWSEDRKRILVLVDSPEEGAAYALVDLNTGKADFIGDLYEGLKPQDISPVRAIAFKAKDGLDLTGYLTTPRGAEARNLPLVVLPHGGPAARDTPEYDFLSQAMASRGYAVLRLNYRGSDGFGPTFLGAGYGEWGRKMQTDLSDGVRHLAGQGLIDPKRVCIVGASYGGYAALQGAALEPEVYRCAVSVAGVSDLKKMVEWERRTSGQRSERYWLRFMGAEGAKDPDLAPISPALNAGAVKAPILLIHGKDDTVVPLEQSQMMADALKAAGKPVEFVVQESTDHWQTRGDTRLSMLQAVVGFLEKNNPPN